MAWKTAAGGDAAGTRPSSQSVQSGQSAVEVAVACVAVSVSDTVAVDGLLQESLTLQLLESLTRWCPPRPWSWHVCLLR